MMMRDNALPPFIHPQMASSDTGSESLHNCISLMHLHNSGLPGSRKLFWRNVRQECERLSKHVSWRYYQGSLSKRPLDTCC